MKARGIPGLEAEAMTQAGEVRRDVSVPDDRRSIEQHLLDADMIVKPFDMAESGNSTRQMAMHGRRAMC